jgi:hypothetical protein
LIHPSNRGSAGRASRSGSRAALRLGDGIMGMLLPQSWRGITPVRRGAREEGASTQPGERLGTIPATGAAQERRGWTGMGARPEPIENRMRRASRLQGANSTDGTFKSWMSHEGLRPEPGQVRRIVHGERRPAGAARTEASFAPSRRMEMSRPWPAQLSLADSKQGPSARSSKLL